ncbi:MAG: LytR/AlgR family response regulator transcription factor [Mangrovibacterium sp.]
MTLRTLAIDDEPLALQQITKYIEKTPFLELTAACSNALEAINELSKQAVDLIFVDINMPELNGIDFVRSLAQKPMIIFTTAYSEYAIEGFRVDATDYLLKPIGYADFLRSAEKARKFFALQANENSSSAPNDYFFVKSEYKTVQVIIDDILYVESKSEYLQIHQSSSDPIMTLGNMKMMEDRLPAEQFMRIHRSFIINLQKISAIERSHVIMGSERIPIGEMYKETLQQYIGKWLVAKK